MADRFVIFKGVPLPGPAKRGRKLGSKDSRKFAKRGRPQDRDAARKAASAVRSEELTSIKEAAHRFFREHIGFITTEAERSDENKYAERFRDFVRMIVDELKKSPGLFNTYRKLGKLHAEKMKYPTYKRSYYAKSLKRLKEELKSIGLIE